ncbi:MAG: chalcone isomerase family protein [Gammaproteobacteria bacterium]|nr:chalcone isomerase family protein [Gammaproteobacteria bacterium]
MRILCVVLALILNTAMAAELAGVKIADQVEVGDAVLVLNGAGLRKKYFVKVYVGALYLPKKTTISDQAIHMAGARQINMHFLRDVEAGKITQGWTEGFTKNAEPGDLELLQDKLNEFNAMFEDMSEGDAILLQYEPGLGTRVAVRDEHKGIIPGEEFMQMLLSVWLGEHPADEHLKQAMLGKD